MKEIKANKVGLLASINRLYQEPLSRNILTWVSFGREIVWYDSVNRTGTYFIPERHIHVMIQS
jgi:hypothetical protein